MLHCLTSFSELIGEAALSVSELVNLYNLWCTQHAYVISVLYAETSP